MKTRYEAFDQKYPGLKNQRLRPPPRGPVGRPVDSASDPSPPEAGNHAATADMDYLEVVKQHATPDVQLPAGMPPGEFGSVGGHAGGVLEGEPGSVYHPEEAISHPIEALPPIFHGGKRKRARRGQGFGPRRD